MSNAIKIKRVHPDARMPTFANDGDACFDLYAVTGGQIPPGCAVTFTTGLAFQPPPGHCIKIYSRSGHGFKHGIRLSNGTGIIDAGYTGVVHVRLHNDGKFAYRVECGERIAQAMLVARPDVILVEADSLDDTQRGSNGFGSSGK